MLSVSNHSSACLSSVIDAPVYFGAYVCVYICVYVYIYVHYYAQPRARTHRPDWMEMDLGIVEAGCRDTSNYHWWSPNEDWAFNVYTVDSSPQISRMSHLCEYSRLIHKLLASGHQVHEPHRYEFPLIILRSPNSPTYIIQIDWCCFYYFVENSLVDLLEAVCARGGAGD